MIPTPPLTDSVALYVVGALALVLISILGLVIRAIIQGKLLPQSTVSSMLAERDQRITEQAETIKSAVTLTTEQSKTITLQADALSDLGEAQSLQVRVANAMHEKWLTTSGSGGDA